MTKTMEEGMGKIFCLMGKSSSGKDTIFGDLIKEKELGLLPVISYTTRPMRVNEVEGREYHFITEKQLKDYQVIDKIIEHRVYQTVYGPWHYATIDDGQINLESHHYLMIVTLEAYNSLVRYFGADKVIPLYVEVEDGLRLERAIQREKQQVNPNYEEICRRFLADSKDFSKELLEEAKILHFYKNIDLEICKDEIRAAILKTINGIS